MYWYLKVIKEYANFKGRARRKEYWMFLVFNMLFAIVALIIDNVAGIAQRELGVGPIYLLYAIFSFIPSLAVVSRRLHDTGKSGWMVLVSLIPFIGGIWLLVLLATEGDAKVNEYGQDPKNPEADDFIETEATVNNSDTIILLVVIWMFINRMMWSIMPLIMGNFFSDDIFRTINKFTSLIWAFIPLTLAFTVKDKSKQMILFIIGGLYLLNGLYETVMQFM